MLDHADALEIGCAMSIGDSLTLDLESGQNGGMLALTVTEAEQSATIVLDDDGEERLWKLLDDRRAERTAVAA